MRSCRLVMLAGIAAMAGAQTPISVRVLLGATDTQAVKWDGSVQAQDATVLSLEPWRFEGADSISGAQWQISTHPMRRFAGAAAANPAPVVANGIVINLSSAGQGRLRFSTAQGNFEIGVNETPYGRA